MSKYQYHSANRGGYGASKGKSSASGSSRNSKGFSTYKEATAFADDSNKDNDDSFIAKFLQSLGLIKKPNTAASARDRLQVVVSHQRRHRTSPDYLPMLEKDILAVISKYVDIDEDKVDIRFDRHNATSTLEVNIELPSDATVKVRATKTEGSNDSGKAKSDSKETA
jgi:cell division topological specificity factor